MSDETITISLLEFRALEAKLKRAESKLARRRKALKEKTTEIEKLKRHIEKLSRMLFGKRSEKLNPDQLKLAFESWDSSQQAKPQFPKDTLKTPDEEHDQPKKRKKKTKGGRKKLPDHLPRETQVLEPESKELICECCKTPKVQIGEEKTEKLSYEPRVYKVVEIIRPKYACQTCRKGITIAALPYQTIEKGKATAQFLAHLVTQKYGYHLPLDRQRAMFLEHGIDLGTPTLSYWIKQVAELLEPLAEAIQDEALGHYLVGFDETSIKTRDPTAAKKIRNGHLWLFCGDEGEVRCHATVTKSGKKAKKVLQNYKGYVQADAATPFDVVYRSGDRVEVGCWAHCRRYFEAAATKGDEACQWAMLVIARIYRIDKAPEINSDESRLKARQTQTRPLVEELFRWFHALAKSMIESDAFYGGVTYALNQEDALRRFLEDGRLPLDNSRVERNMKRIAIGRKNWLFAGSPAGAERAAVIYSVILSCQELELPLWEYMSETLEKLPGTALSEVKDLTPRAWKAQRDSKA